jgi:hypothetical protein
LKINGSDKNFSGIRRETLAKVDASQIRILLLFISGYFNIQLNVGLKIKQIVLKIKN